MVLIDANYVLRYLLEDVEEQFKIASKVLEKEKVFIPDFIIAEVVYVLEKVYAVNRKEIKDTLSNLVNYSNILVAEKSVIKSSLKLYSTHKIDYSDALLIAYYQSVETGKLYTFDKSILKIIKP